MGIRLVFPKNEEELREKKKEWAARGWTMAEKPTIKPDGSYEVKLRTPDSEKGGDER